MSKTRKPYTKEELIAELEQIEDFRFLYDNDIINYRGRSSPKNDRYTEIIAGWIIENIESLHQIAPIHRESSYYSKSHDELAKQIEGSWEKHIAKKIFCQEKLRGVGRFLDFETPLNDKRKDKAGEIDLLAFDEKKKVLRILELKHPNNDETMLRCVLEGYTYLKLVDEVKLIRDFNRDGNANIPEDTTIIACPLVFRHTTKGEDGYQYRELMEARPKLRKLMELLNVEPIYIEQVGEEYKVVQS